MGAGHLVRCLALAQAWRDRGGAPAVLATACDNERLLQWYRDEGCEVVRIQGDAGGEADWRRTAEAISGRHVSWFALDGYHFTASYRRRVKEHRYRLLLIDDLARPDDCHADLIVNQNIYASSACYPPGPFAALLGTRYCLLRREFRSGTQAARHIAGIGRRVFVSLGGGDASIPVSKVLEALGRVEVDGLEATIVVGPGATDVPMLRARAAALPFVRFVHGAGQISGFMRWADAAVISAGSTCWEAACTGLPSIVLVLADNQRAVAEALEEAGVMVSAGWHAEATADDIARRLAALLRDPSRREEMARRGQTLVDGRGAERVVRCMQAMTLSVRPVVEADSRLLWTWANDPAARQASFSSRPIPWEEHLRWMHRKLNDRNCYYFVLLDAGGQPVGQVRFDAAGDGAVVSVSLGPEFRGHGYGASGLRLACARLFSVSRVQRVIAYVKPDNDASVRAFAAAGFVHAGSEQVEGQSASRLVLERDQVRFPRQATGCN